MKIFKKVIAGLLVSATLFSFGACSNKGEVTSISEDDFISFLENDMKWSKGDKYDYVDAYAFDQAVITDEEDGSKTLSYEEITTSAILVSHVDDFNDPMIAYCIFDTNEDARVFFEGFVAMTAFYNDNPGAFSYNEGSNGYIMFKFGKNSWDAYYYFDNVVIHVNCVGEEERNQVNKLLKENGFPLIPQDF